MKKISAWPAVLMIALIASAVSATRVGEITALWSIHEVGGGRLSLPTDVALGKDGTLYIVDSGHNRVVKFGPLGDYRGTLGGVEQGANALNEPIGLGLDRNGHIYVADAGNNRIQVYDGTGAVLRSIPVMEEGVAIRPVDVAVSERTGEIFVTGNTNHKVMKFNSIGKPLGAWGHEGTNQGEFRYPGTIEVKEGRVYVVDVLNTRVQVFDDKGDFQYQIGEWGVLPGQLFRPKGVALDNRGWIYVTDSYMGVIQVFDTGYKFIHTLGIKGKTHKFDTPTGIAIGADDRLFVAEMLAHKVSAFALE